MTQVNDIVVGIGEVLWDMLPAGKQIGGAPANFAYHVSRLGINTRIVSAVGNDPLGKEILNDFLQKHLRHFMEVVPFPTGTVEVSLHAAGIPSYHISENAAWDNIPFSPTIRQLARDTSAVCFGSLAQRSEVSRRTICQFLDTMPDGERRYKIFDINLRQHFFSREIIDESLRRCNILKLNDEELTTLGSMFGLPSNDMEYACRTIIERYNLKAVILTCGAGGSYVFTTHETSFCPTPHIEVADTVGAGDAFTAAFISVILQGKPTKEAHRFAVDVAAFVCTRQGAMPPYPLSLKIP